MRIVEFQSFSARIATVARIVWIPAGVNLFSQLARRLSSDRETTSGLKPVDRLDVERSSSNQQAVWKLGMAASAVNNSQAGAKPAMLFCTCGVCSMQLLCQIGGRHLDSDSILRVSVGRLWRRWLSLMWKFHLIEHIQAN